MTRLAKLAPFAIVIAFLGVACIPPPPPPAGLLFGDEFNGTTVDLSKWQPNWLGPNNTAITKPVNGAEESCYDPAQATESGGALHLNAVQRTCQADRTYSYASGMVESRPHFTFTNGYIEVRAYLPGGSSIANWPAIWTNGTGTWPQTGENDIMEGLSGRACWHYHSPSGGPGGCASSNFVGWHTFGADVQSGTCTYYYDGVRVGSEASVQAPHYIILNNAVSSSIGGPKVIPATMQVDYLRVYSHKP